ncbi:MAG TPA: family 43 glycosylhydrolase, partial [Flavitalea sp.]|nr:family 43 glycosylhydrolase [Flavitalea sp.]
QPPPIWAMEMDEGRTKLVGTKKELFRNDMTWEGNLVEGVSMIKKNGYYYAFYAGAGCCGKGCTYTTGIARSKQLLGPWEKYAHNPVLVNDSTWKCPGHGTPIEKDGRNFLLYHAYDKKTDVYTGREGLLMEYRFSTDGWIEFIKKPGSARLTRFTDKDNFSGKNLSADWQWSVFQKPQTEINGGMLILKSVPVYGTYIGRKTLGGNYTATATIQAEKSNATTGVGMIGDEKNRVAVLYTGDRIQVISMRDGASTIVKEERVSAKKRIDLRIRVSNGNQVLFEYRAAGKSFIPLNDEPLNAVYLPPWDRAVRIGLISLGEKGRQSVFDDLEIEYE